LISILDLNQEMKTTLIEEYSAEKEPDDGEIVHATGKSNHQEAGKLSSSQSSPGVGDRKNAPFIMFNLQIRHDSRMTLRLSEMSSG
jgi:hypothetical protein